MSFRKILCLAMALMLALGTLALAESDDLQAQLDAANARIAELEALIEQYKPIYESQIVAEFAGDGVVLLADAQAQYSAITQMYAQYGIPVDSYSGEIKQNILNGLVQQDVLERKGAELGLDQLDEAAEAEIEQQAEEDLENYISYYGSYFATEGATDEENRTATIEGLAKAGYTKELMYNDRKAEYVNDKLVEYVTKDITVTDDEIQAEYKSLVDDAKDSFNADDYTYNSTRSSGSVIAWNPEGYRAVKHVLIMFSDDQAAQYNELQSTLNSLREELEALDAPAEETEEAAEDGEAAEDEEAKAPRTREEIEADMGNIGTAIEALYSELLPKAQEVIDAFNNGTDFDTLIAQYGEDPGMKNEPTATIGYAVAENSSYWEDAFTEGAMAIPEVGKISEPVRGSNGIHIIYYMNDITPGDVPFEDIKDAVEASALEEKKTAAYDDQVAAWVEEANPVYHMDRFI